MSDQKIREVIITQDDIIDNVWKYPKTDQIQYEHRPYVADRFMAEHGCVILDFGKIRYLQSKCGTAIRAQGRIGESLSAPVK